MKSVLKEEMAQNRRIKSPKSVGRKNTKRNYEYKLTVHLHVNNIKQLYKQIIISKTNSTEASGHPYIFN